MNHAQIRRFDKKYHPVVRILAFLAEQKIATIHQIHQFCFSGTTERNVRRFLTDLAKRNWIANQAILGKSLKPTLAYKLTDTGFEELKAIIGLETEKVQTRVNRREHDVALTDIRIRFGYAPKATIYLSENILQTGIFEGICPQLVHFKSGHHDGAVQLVVNDKKIWMAVEYERSDKTMDRNLERFRSWYQSEELNGILLIAEDESFMKRLIQIDRLTYPNLKRKVLFQHLAEFLQDKPSVSFVTSQERKLAFEFGKLLNTVYPILEQDLSF